MSEKGYVDFISEMIMEKYPESNLKIFNSVIPGIRPPGAQVEVEVEFRLGVFHQVCFNLWRAEVARLQARALSGRNALRIASRSIFSFGPIMRPPGRGATCCLPFMKVTR